MTCENLVAKFWTWIAKVWTYENLVNIFWTWVAKVWAYQILVSTDFRDQVLVCPDFRDQILVCPDFRDPRLDSSSDFPDSQSWHDYAIWVLMRMQRDSSPDFPDFRPRLSILKLSARLCNLGLDRMLCDPRSNHGATLAKTVRLFRPRRGRRDFRDQGGNGATLQTKARSAQLSRPRRTWRRRLSKLAYIGLKGASRNISRSVNQKWISQNRTKGGPIGSAGGRIPEGGGVPPKSSVAMVCVIRRGSLKNYQACLSIVFFINSPFLNKVSFFIKLIQGWI